MARLTMEKSDISAEKHPQKTIQSHFSKKMI